MEWETHPAVNDSELSFRSTDTERAILIIYTVNFTSKFSSNSRAKLIKFDNLNSR